MIFILLTYLIVALFGSPLILEDVNMEMAKCIGYIVLIIAMIDI